MMGRSVHRDDSLIARVRLKQSTLLCSSHYLRDVLWLGMDWQMQEIVDYCR
jgi:hypothetical protein